MAMRPLTGDSPISNDGENVITTLQQTRRFLGEVAKLLQTADAAMENGSWSTCESKAVRPSTTINTADEWLPEFAFRYYENEEQKHLLPFIAVLFDYEDEEIKLKRLQEPLLTAGWYDYGAGGEVDDCPWHYAVVHVYNREWEADGKWRQSDPRTIFPKSWPRGTAVRCRSLALPLMSFASAEDLTQRVVKPLLEDIQSFSGKAK
jgi:hypothetical protein